MVLVDSGEAFSDKRESIVATRWRWNGHYNRFCTKWSWFITDIKYCFGSHLSSWLWYWKWSFGIPFGWVNLNDEFSFMLWIRHKLNWQGLSLSKSNSKMLSRFRLWWKCNQIKIILIYSQIRASENQFSCHCTSLQWQVFKCTRSLTIWWNGETRRDTDSIDFAFGIEVDCILKRILNFDRMLANRCCQVDGINSSSCSCLEVNQRTRNSPEASFLKKTLAWTMPSLCANKFKE